MRVFSRFFKKSIPVDADTQVEEDPVQVELDGVRAEMAAIERERIREKIEVEKYKMNDEQMNK